MKGIYKEKCPFNFFGWQQGQKLSIRKARDEKKTI